MTWQRVDKDRFILVISLNLVPLEPAFETLSEPAKSTMLSLPHLTITFFCYGLLLSCSTEIWNKAWDLLETWFILVAPVTLFLAPNFSKL